MSLGRCPNGEGLRLAWVKGTTHNFKRDHALSKGASTDPTTHFWWNAAHTAGFGGDDFAPSFGDPSDNVPPYLPPDEASQMATNSVNLGFLTSSFGPLATSTLAGTQYDITLQVLDHGQVFGSVHDHLLLA